MHEEELPRPGSSLYKLIHPDEEVRLKTLKKINKYVILPLYKLRLLPLLGFGRIFLILTTKGRKSGKLRRTPLEYHWIDDVITIFSGRGEDSDWLKNVRANPDNVWVKHGFHSFQSRVEILTDEKDKLSIIRWYVVKHPKAAKFLFGWNPRIDDPDITDFSKLLNSIAIIHLYRQTE